MVGIWRETLRQRRSRWYASPTKGSGPTIQTWQQLPDFPILLLVYVYSNFRGIYRAGPVLIAGGHRNHGASKKTKLLKKGEVSKRDEKEAPVI